MIGYITSSTRFHVSSQEVADDIDRVTTANLAGTKAHLRDGTALTIAASWQSSGTVGCALAALASTGTVGSDALVTDITHTLRETDSHTDRQALNLLLAWAVEHPSLLSEE